MNHLVHAIVQRRFDGAAERVLDEWFDPVWLGRWMFGPNIRDEPFVRLGLAPRIGGEISFVSHRSGVAPDHVEEPRGMDRPWLFVFVCATRDTRREMSRVIGKSAARPRPRGKTYARQARPLVSVHRPGRSLLVDVLDASERALD